MLRDVEICQMQNGSPLNEILRFIRLHLLENVLWQRGGQETFTIIIGVSIQRTSLIFTHKVDLVVPSLCMFSYHLLFLFCI